jgi:hypothetical protein
MPTVAAMVRVGTEAGGWEPLWMGLGRWTAWQWSSSEKGGGGRGGGEYGGGGGVG